MNNIKYNNKIILVDKLYLENLTEGTQRIVVDGRNMHTEKEFISELENAFKFPRSCEGNRRVFKFRFENKRWNNRVVPNVYFDLLGWRVLNSRRGKKRIYSVFN